MKALLLKCSLFVGVSAAGLLVFHVATILLMKYELFPDVNAMPASTFEVFKQVYWGGGIMAWIVGALLALGIFFIESEKKKWFIAAPFYMPFFYVVGVLTYYM